MAAGGLGRSHRAGHGHQRAVEFGGVAGGVERAAAFPGFDDDGAVGEGGDDTVADQESQPGGVAAGWQFADDQSAAGDGGEQGVVPGGVGVVNPQASTTMVVPRAVKAPRWTAASMP